MSPSGYALASVKDLGVPLSTTITANVLYEQYHVENNRTLKSVDPVTEKPDIAKPVTANRSVIHGTRGVCPVL